MRKAHLIAILLMALVLINACKILKQNKISEQELQDFYQSHISFKLEHPQQLKSDEELSIKFYVTNGLEFPVTLSSITFPFADFQFVNEKDERAFAVSTSYSIAANAASAVEYKAKKNMEADLGRGFISSLIQFNFQINDPKYGNRTLRRNENFVLTFI